MLKVGCMGQVLNPEVHCHVIVLFLLLFLNENIVIV